MDDTKQLLGHQSSPSPALLMKIQNLVNFFMEELETAAIELALEASLRKDFENLLCDLKQIRKVSVAESKWASQEEEILQKLKVILSQLYSELFKQ